jgi:iron complex outermembrane receptor protein
LNDKLTISSNLAVTTKNADYGQIASFRYAVYANPTMPVYNNDPDNGGRYGGYYQQQLYDYYNPLAIVEQNPNVGKDLRLVMSLKGEYQITDDLRFSAFYSQQRENDLRQSYISKTSYWNNGYPKGRASQRTDNRLNELLEYSVGYDKLFGDLHFAFVGGYSYQNFIFEGFGATGGNFVSDAFTYNNLGAGLDFANGLGSVFSYKNSYELQAGFGRINLNFNDTYFLSLSGRYEGSSRFGENNKYGFFPAASGGVNLTNLMDLPSVNNLKLRASYGVTGNIPGESYISLLRFGQVGNFYYNGSYGPSYGPVANANPNLKWERKQEVDFGVDFGMLGNRLTGTIDYYSRQTFDLILPFNVPQPPNLAATTYVNVGQMNNSGFEFSLNYDVINTGDFSWSTGINATTLKTKLVSLSKGDVEFGANGVAYGAPVGAPGQSGTNQIRVAEGEPIGQIWGPIYDGVNADGTVKLKDLNGDGSYCDCDDDRTVIGSGLPKAFGGWNNTFKYKNWDFNFFIRATFGHDLVNQFRTFYEPLIPGQVGSYNRVNSKHYDPKIQEAKFSSYYVEKADYVKLDNATLGYTFPVKPSSQIRSFRVYLSTQNLFTLTGYTGVDPTERYGDSENNNNPLYPGIERRDTYFTSRTLTLGLNLGF